MIEKINDNAYKLDLPSEYQVSATFNVTDLSLFDAGDEFDSRTNPFQEGGNDENSTKANNVQDQLQGVDGPLTRARAKRLKEALQGLVMEAKIQSNPVEHEFPKWTNLIQLEE